MPLLTDENGDRPDGRQGLRSQKGDGVHGRIDLWNIDFCGIDLRSTDSLQFRPDYSSGSQGWQSTRPQKITFVPARDIPSRARSISRGWRPAFPSCRECPLRDDARQVAPKASGQWAPMESERTQRRELFVTEGVRGVFLNELTRRGPRQSRRPLRACCGRSRRSAAATTESIAAHARCGRRLSSATTSGPRRRASSAAWSPACAARAVM